MQELIRSPVYLQHASLLWQRAAVNIKCRLFRYARYVAGTHVAKHWRHSHASSKDSRAVLDSFQRTENCSCSEERTGWGEGLLAATKINLGLPQVLAHYSSSCFYYLTNRNSPFPVTISTLRHRRQPFLVFFCKLECVSESILWRKKSNVTMRRPALAASMWAIPLGRFSLLTVLYTCMFMGRVTRFK